MPLNDFLHQSNLLSTIINIVTFLIIIYFMYQFFTEYKREKEFQENNITSYKDMDNFINEYQDTDICKKYINLNDKEKDFLYHLTAAHHIKYKEDNPKVTKRFNSLKTQLLINMIITFLLKQKTSAVAESLKHNTLFAFFSTI